MKRPTLVALAALTCCAVHLGIVAVIAGAVGGWWAAGPVLVLLVAAVAARTHLKRREHADHG